MYNVQRKKIISNRIYSFATSLTSLEISFASALSFIAAIYAVDASTS